MDARDAANRDLLIGLLALQNGLVDQTVLVAAFHTWTRDKSRPIADILAAQGAIDADDRALLEGLAARHLRRHGGDPQRSLAALHAGRSAREGLTKLGDPDIEGTLARLGSGPAGDDGDGRAGQTMSMTAGGATSDGRRFRVLRPHARGGLGAVFVALDEELHREVALKQILDHHADDPTSRTRFVLEAEITGGLEHPGIVPVYGMGSYGDGRPYYAMRFVRGDSLKEAIERFHSGGPGSRDLPLRRLLRRFLDVCNAIDYAHSRGVLHRDIKPANVIVGKHGETLVVDWGLAKVMGNAEAGAAADERSLMPSSASGSSETLPGSALGTPAYMSPEQAAGDLDRLGPRSDVYSLGATLYCLLTGKPPFEGHDIGAVLRAVHTGDFPPPRALDRSTDPALEAVCLKAMATRPEDRYPSSRALADDVERWAADEPVTAYREPLARRARRWAKRNRTAVTAAAAALVAGVVGLSAVLAVQAKATADIARSLASETRANAALATANAELTRSKTAVQDRYDLAVDAIKTFHTGVSEDFLLKEEKFKELRGRLLRSAADFYGKLGALLGTETDFASRRALARANYEVAGLTSTVGRREDALAAHRAVLGRREALAADPAADPETKADVGRSLAAVAFLLGTTGKTVEAEATYRRAEALLADLARSSPSAPAARAALAVCRSGLGSLLFTTGKSVDSLAAYRLARADQEATAAAPEASTAARRDLADTINRIGTVLSRTGKPAEAEAEYHTAIALQQTLADDNPADTDFRSRLAGSHSSLGLLLSDTGKLKEAEAEYRKALTLQQKLADGNPAVSHFRSRLADSHTGLGGLLSDTGKPAEAEAEYHAALALYQKLADDNPADTDFRSRMAGSHHNLGGLLSQTGKPAEAEAEYRKALAVQQKLAEENPAVVQFRVYLANHHGALGLLLSDTGKPAEAEAEYHAALALYRKLADDNPTSTHFRSSLAAVHHNLGRLLADRGKPAEAEAEYRKALAVQQKLADDNPAVTNFNLFLANHHSALGGLLSRTGKPAEAEAEYRKALALYRKLADDNPAVTEIRSSLALSHTGLGILLSNTGRPTEAEAEHREALALCQKLADDNPTIAVYRYDLACGHTNLADDLRKVGRAAQAREGQEKAIAILEALFKSNPETTMYRTGLADSVRGLGLVRLLSGDTAGAVADARKAAVLYEGLPPRSGEEWYGLACCLAALAGAAGREGSGLSTGDGEAEADKAMGLLRRAAAHGYRNAAAMGIEVALDSLRDRPAFRLLVLDLAFPDDPFAG